MEELNFEDDLTLDEGELLQKARDRSFSPEVFYEALKITLKESGYEDCPLNVCRIMELKGNGAIEIFTRQDFLALKEKKEKNLFRDPNKDEKSVRDAITSQFVKKILGCDLSFLEFIFRDSYDAEYKTDLLFCCNNIDNFLDLDLTEFTRCCRPVSMKRNPTHDSRLADHHFPMISFISESLLDEKIRDIRAKDSPFVKYLDSSIWNYLIGVSKDQTAPIDPTQASIKDLKRAYIEVTANYKNNLYRTVNALEFAEFRTRQLRNSYIAGFTKEGSTDSLEEHNLIVPYRFHSRSEINSNIEDRERLKGKAWKFLLVDDKAQTALTSVNDRTSISKKKIIENLFKNSNLTELPLDKMLGIGTIQERRGQAEHWEFDATEIYFHIEIAERYEDFIQKLNEGNIYDIILLDQLLDSKSDTGSASARHRGSDFLKALNDKHSIVNWSDTTHTLAHKVSNQEQPFLQHTDEAVEKRGKADALKFISTPAPFRSYWIFPVTVFSEDFFDTLQLEGINYFGENYRLFKGADPINQPNLFMFSLLKLMSQQVNAAPFMEVKSVLRYLSDVWMTTRRETHFNNKNVPEFQDDIRRIYGLFQYKFSDISSLRREANLDEGGDQLKGSFLANSLYHHQDYAAIAFYDSLRQVLQLCAYGSFQDYVRIHHSLKKARSILKNAKGIDSDHKHTYERIEENIHDFIDFLNQNH